MWTLTVTLTLVGDMLIFGGFAATICVYRSQQVQSENQLIDATLGVLHGIRDGMKPWADNHFGGSGWDEVQAAARAEKDRQCVREGVYFLNYRVPTELIVNLLQHSGTRAALSSETITLAGEALRKVGIFNQIVQQQTDFLAAHLPEIYYPTLEPARREALARTFQ